MAEKKSQTEVITAAVFAATEDPDVLFAVAARIVVQVLRTHGELKGAIVNALISQVLAPFGGYPSLSIRWKRDAG